MPLLAVKSFDSSTNAFAGSQAAQHNVNCLVWAAASPPRHEATTAAVKPNARTVWIIATSLMCRQLPACPCQSSPAANAGTDPPSSRREACLVFLFSYRLSLNIEGVNGAANLFRQCRLLLQ